MRRSPALTAAATVVAAVLTVGALSGCSNIQLPDLSGACKPVYQPGSASDLVTATGDAGAAPEIDFPTPLIAGGPERTVLIEGEGEPLPANGVADLEATLFDGADGTLLQQTDYAGAPIRFIANDTQKAISEALVCAKQGSRFVLAVREADITADDAEAPPEERTIILVIDVVKTWLGKANGINQLPLDGMPTVATAVDGQPGILVPAEPAPTQSRTSVIKAGGGAVVHDGDTAVLHIRSWGWPATPGDKPFQDSDTWASAPESVEISDDMARGATFAGAVRGAKVGSQLLIVVEAEEAGGVATIFVVDVLGIERSDDAESE